MPSFLRLGKGVCSPVVSPSCEDPDLRPCRPVLHLCGTASSRSARHHEPVPEPAANVTSFLPSIMALTTFPYYEDYFSVPIYTALYLPLKTALKLSHNATTAAQTGEPQEK